MKFALLFLLLAPNPAELSRSELVSDGHDHQWIEIERDEEEVILLDRALMPDYSDDTGSYPTILVRSIGVGNDESHRTFDATAALDCKRSMFAVTAFLRPESEGESSQIPPPPIGEFVQANDKADEVFLTAMFQHVCGPEWKFKAG